jgi:tetratricopeptide (TPR) repeat protein
MAKIYISSTYEDLKEYRHAVYSLLEKMQRHQIVKMENYVAADQRPLDKCLADVAACDVYVGLFAQRYGYIPPADNPQQQSITEREFREAVRTGKPCLIFLLDSKAAWPKEYVEQGDGANRLAAFRTELATDYLTSFFHTAAELAGLVSVAVSNWENAQTPQGINPEAWQQMLARLGQKDFDLQQREEEIKEWVRKYRELEQQLAAEGQDSSLAQQAQTFLQAGQLDEAGRLLDQLLASDEAEVERIASHYFSRARVFDLQFQPLAALPHYAKAYQYRPDNPAYAQAYAITLQTQHEYGKAEPVYVAVLQTFRDPTATAPVAYLPDIARTLNNLGLLYSDTQRFAKAEEAHQEAIRTYRELAAANPAAEGVSELLICYPSWVLERSRTTREIASNDDYASSALSLLPRHGYCAAWHHARREATVSVPGMPGSRADLSPGVRVRRAIA